MSLEWNSADVLIQFLQQDTYNNWGSTCAAGYEGGGGGRGGGAHNCRNSLDVKCACVHKGIIRAQHLLDGSTIANPAVNRRAGVQYACMLLFPHVFLASGIIYAAAFVRVYVLTSRSQTLSQPKLTQHDNAVITCCT